MKRNWLVLSCILTTFATSGQTLTGEYFELVRRADTLYNKKEYKYSAFTYSAAFKVNAWKGNAIDRYQAAVSWALAGYPDSAFLHLERVAKEGLFTDGEGDINDEPAFTSLHQDPRWKPLRALITAKKEKAKANFNNPLVRKLNSIFTDDQNYRLKIPDIEKEYGWESKEMKELWKTISEKDSVNLMEITKILDEYGWLGADVVGGRGNDALFLVIQHADQGTQEKYLPMMREAVKKGNAKGSSLALLEDRVALKQGRKQIYGSQIGRDEKTGKYVVSPIEDEPNVNKRRAQVGLEPLEDYARQWDIDYKLPTK